MLNSTCVWPQCDRLAFARGLCQRCNMRARRAGTLHTFTSPDVACRHCRRTYAEGTKAGKWFCSATCQRDASRQLQALRRVQEIGERNCAFCQGPVPLSLRKDARHCSVPCQQASWYLANNERLRKAARQWATENRDLVIEANERRRARKLAVECERVNVQDVYARDRGYCWICSRPVDLSVRYPNPMSRSLDHVIPLSKGGSHTMANVALAHLRCNISKKDRLLEYLPHWFDSEGEEVPGVVAESA